MANHFSWGISLSGGSLGSLAYVSFLQTLKEEFDLQPQLLAGLSGGSMAAPLIAAGLDKEEIFAIYSQLTIRKLLNHHPRNLELIDHHKFAEFFREQLPIKRFEDLPTPVLIFATDLKQQQAEVIDSGDIASAIVASCSVYPLLKPVRRLGKILTDGGYTTYYGAQFLRKHNVDRVVGVDVTGINEGTTPRFLKSLYLSVNAALSSNARYELTQYPVDLDIRLDVTAPMLGNLAEEKERMFSTGSEAARKYGPKLLTIVGQK